MHLNRDRERGQVLPLWAFGATTTLALMFLAINYANAVRYQIRAQNAADSAAQALVSIQAQRFNLMNIMLYASNVEEYRARKTLDGAMLALYSSGGCNLQVSLPAVPGPPTVANSNQADSCGRAYEAERGQFLRTVNRYTTDISLLNSITATNTYTNWTTDAKTLLGSLNSIANCGDPTKVAVTGDCALFYKLNAAQERSNLLAVTEDAAAINVPGLGYTAGPANDLQNKEFFSPVAVDITTCVQVPPLIPNFGPIHLAPSYAVGRAAAANTMVEEDWMQPGSLDDPARAASGQRFQPQETYAQSSDKDATGNGSIYDWYGVNFGGNTTYAYPTYASFAVPGLNNDELSVRVGWWNAIPIKPFGPSIASAAGACK